MLCWLPRPAALGLSGIGLGRGGQEDRPCGRQSAGRLLQPDQAVRRSLRQGEGHRGHHRRRQGRFRDPGQPGPGPHHPEHRRADLHPGRRHRRDRADQDGQGGRHPGDQCRPQRRRRAGRHLHRHRKRRLRQGGLRLHRQAGRRRGRDDHHPWPEGHDARGRPLEGLRARLAANPGIKVVGELWSEGGTRTKASR